MDNNQNLTNNTGVDSASSQIDASSGEQTAHGKHHSSHHHGHHSHHGHGGSHSKHGSSHSKNGNSKHRRSHSSSHSNSNSPKKRSISTKAKWSIVISVCVVFVALVVVWSVLSSQYPDFMHPQTGENSSDILKIQVVNPEGVLVKNAVEKYLRADILNTANADKTLSSYSKDEGRLDAQVPVSLKLSVKEGNALSYKIELADNDSFENARISYLEAASGVCEFEHLYANTTYYYRVTVYTRTGIDTATGHFRTADTPRILSIDGLSNVRDIGNWKTDSGKRIKQGLLIRGTEMDAAVESGYHLTNEGLVDMIEVFGIKTDIDLRAQTATSMDALGPRVEHIYYDMVMYADVFTDNGKDKIRMVFSDLSEPDNYPIYLHCTYGCDRTGTVCYLLEALLGVSRGDCLRDYGLSNLNLANIQAVENGLKNYEGDTLKEQVESYLLSCGVTEYQIDSIRNIFLGE